MTRTRPGRMAQGVAAGCLAALASAGHAVTICSSGGIEMIVGGSVAAACPPAAAANVGAARPGASAAARVEPAVQRERDQERRRILEDELQREQAVLSGLLKQGPAADPARLARTQSNLVALRHELARGTP